MSEAEAEQFKQQLSGTKDFLESLQAYNSVGKLKNFRFSADEVIAHSSGLEQLAEINKLQLLVSELNGLTSYLSKAEAVLPLKHKEVEGWQSSLKAVRAELTESLSDAKRRGKSGFQSKAIKQLTELKSEYIRIYSGLYAHARLTTSEDKRKADLLNDNRVDQLQALSTIDILPGNQLIEFRDALGGLKVAGSLVEKDLLIDPVPNNSDFQPNHEDLTVTASQKLEQLEKRLENMVMDWQQTLLENLEDPVTHESLSLLTADERSMIDGFISSKALPDSLDKRFVKALRQVLQGLVPIELTIDQLERALFGQGSAATVDQLKARLDQFLVEQCRGQDVSKVRIVIK